MNQKSILLWSFNFFVTGFTDKIGIKLKNTTNKVTEKQARISVRRDFESQALWKGQLAVT